MTPLNAIDELDTCLVRTLARYPAGDPALFLNMPTPAQLAVTAQDLAQKFVEGKPAEPPSQARINALARLRVSDPNLTRRGWNLIAWGLCDDCGRAGKPIDDEKMTVRVFDYLDTQATGNDIRRRFWFGLLHSYFAYASHDPATNQNWVAMRKRLLETADQLITSQRRPKAWTSVLAANMELLSPKAGEQLADAISQGHDSRYSRT